MIRRSNAPVFWLLFGAGGMLCALLGTALVAITGICAPLGCLLPADWLSYPRALAFSRHWLGKGFLLVVISLFAWHAVHRLFHSLHDLGLHTGVLAKGICYGGALAMTLVTAMSLARLGW
jgi:fumarate reductase subunit D